MDCKGLGLGGFFFSSTGGEPPQGHPTSHADVSRGRGSILLPETCRGGREPPGPSLGKPSVRAENWALLWAQTEARGSCRLNAALRHPCQTHTGLRLILECPQPSAALGPSKGENPPNKPRELPRSEDAVMCVILLVKDKQVISEIRFPPNFSEILEPSVLQID